MKLHKSPKKEELTGISGWLLVSVIGLFLTIGLNLFDLLDSLLFYSFEEVYYLVFTNFFVLTLSGITLFCIFKKLKLGKTMAMASYCFFALISLSYLEIEAMLVQILWVGYYYKSKRVENTLVN